MTFVSSKFNFNQPDKQPILLPLFKNNKNLYNINEFNGFNIISRKQYKHPYVTYNNRINSKQRLQQYFLYEKFGSFDFQDKYFLNVFADLIYQAMEFKYNNFSNDFDICKLYQQYPYQYIKFQLTDIDTSKLAEYKNKLNAFKNLNLLNVYITFDSRQLDVCTIMYPLDETEEKIFNKTELPLYTYNQKTNNITGTLIISLTANDLKRNPNELAGIILHEFVHALNSINSISMDNNLIFANDLSYKITNHIPTCEDIVKIYCELKNNNYKFKSYESIYTFLSACIYYCDKSERAAYMSNFTADCDIALQDGFDFNGNNKRIQQFLYPISLPNRIVQKHNYFYSESYTIYFLLYTIMYNANKLYGQIINTQLNLSNDKIIKEILSTYNIKYHMSDVATNILLKNKTINGYCNIWQRAVRKWLIVRATKLMNYYQQNLIK